MAESEKLFAERIQQEVQGQIPQSDWLREAYVDFLKHHSQFTVEELKFHGDDLVVVTLSVQTYPIAQRRTLMNVASRVEPGKARQFNFANALQMISERKSEPLILEKESAGVFRFRKNSSGEWTLQK